MGRLQRNSFKRFADCRPPADWLGQRDRSELGTEDECPPSILGHAVIAGKQDTGTRLPDMKPELAGVVDDALAFRRGEQVLHVLDEENLAICALDHFHEGSPGFASRIVLTITG